MSDISIQLWDAIQYCKDGAAIDAMKAADAEIEQLRTENHILRGWAEIVADGGFIAGEDKETLRRWLRLHPSTYATKPDTEK